MRRSPGATDQVSLSLVRFDIERQIQLGSAGRKARDDSTYPRSLCNRNLSIFMSVTWGSIAGWRARVGVVRRDSSHGCYSRCRSALLWAELTPRAVVATTAS